MSEPHFIPQQVVDGGSQIGNSYISTFDTCPTKWFNSYLRDFELSQGIKPRWESEHLIKGSTFHEGMEALYRSGIRDGEDTGEWDLQLALATLEIQHLRRQPDYKEMDKWETDKLLLDSMLTNYYNVCGRGSLTQDFPLPAAFAVSKIN